MVNDRLSRKTSWIIASADPRGVNTPTRSPLGLAWGNTQLALLMQRQLSQHLPHVPSDLLTACGQHCLPSS